MRGNTIQVPQVFRVEPASLKSDLERFGSEVKRHADNLENIFARRVEVLSVVTNGNVTAKFEASNRLSPRDGQTINVFLPSPQKANSGRVISLLRKTVTGTIYVYAPNSTVNGQPRLLLDGSIGWSQFLFDGNDYFGDKAHGIPTDEGL